MTLDRPGWSRWLALSLAAILVLGACSSDDSGSDDGSGAGESADGARLVTDVEAQTLAMLRFRNYDAGARSFTARFTEAGVETVLTGRVDYRTHTGFARIDVRDQPMGLLAWDGLTVAVQPDDGLAEGVPEPPGSLAPADGWEISALEPGANPVHSLLAVLAQLGADRPENPLLIRQGGALWLGSEDLDGVEVDVFTGPAPAEGEAGGSGGDGEGTGTGFDDGADTPTGTAELDADASPLRYWVAADGMLVRSEVRHGHTWITVDLGEADGTSVPDLFGSGTATGSAGP